MLLAVVTALALRIASAERAHQLPNDINLSSWKVRCKSVLQLPSVWAALLRNAQFSSVNERRHRSTPCRYPVASSVPNPGAGSHGHAGSSPACLG
jgi:hypothetical protein